MYAKDAKEPASTYTVDFSGEEKKIVIKMADGSSKSVDYVADGCEVESQELEATSGAVTEAANEADVQPAE